MWEGFCQLQIQGFAPGEEQIESDWLSQHTAVSHEPSRMWLVSQGFVLLQGNDPTYTGKLYQRYIKSKEEQHVLQLMSWLVQSANLSPIELLWDELN